MPDPAHSLMYLQHPEVRGENKPGRNMDGAGAAGRGRYIVHEMKCRLANGKEGDRLRFESKLFFNFNALNLMNGRRET
jgi:hypothetical protein